jgi:hypothetical protein
MTLKISKGPRPSPVRAVIYGVSGIGKSTFGAGLPKPLFLDTEESTNQLDVDRVVIPNWQALNTAVAELASSPHGYQTVVIDTADWAERMLIEHLLAKQSKKSIEDFGYGKGYTILAEEFGRFLQLCDGLTSKGIHIVFIAHSKVVRQSPPDQTDGFDRYELKLTKQVAPLLKEWSDLLLFASFQLQIVEGTDGRIKAQGGKERVMHTTNHAAWDAKNRFGLADTVPFNPAEIAGIFAGKVARQPAAVEPVTPAAVVEPVAQVGRITAEQLSKLTTYNGNSVGRTVIAKALEHYNEAALDLLNTEQAAKIIIRCQEEMNKAADKPVAPVVPPQAAPVQPAADTPPAFLWPTDAKAWLESHETAVNAYLVSVKWIKAGQTFRDVACERGDKIIAKPDAFARAANIPTLKKAA